MAAINDVAAYATDAMQSLFHVFQDLEGQVTSMLSQSKSYDAHSSKTSAENAAFNAMIAKVNADNVLMSQQLSQQAVDASAIISLSREKSEMDDKYSELLQEKTRLLNAAHAARDCAEARVKELTSAIAASEDASALATASAESTIQCLRSALDATTRELSVDRAALAASLTALHASKIEVEDASIERDANAREAAAAKAEAQRVTLKLESCVRKNTDMVELLNALKTQSRAAHLPAGPGTGSVRALGVGAGAWLGAGGQGRSALAAGMSGMGSIESDRDAKKPRRK